jgi:predicted Zn-dependent peptidase
MRTLQHSAQEYAWRTLDNGLRVVVDPIPQVRSVSVGIWIKTGSANEHASECGAAHFLEHLFFKGTRTRSARQLVQEVEARGGQFNAFTARDYTCVYIRTLDIHAEHAVEILADVICNSTFADFEKERNVVLEEIASEEDIPEEYVQDLLMMRTWPDHSLGRPISGFLDTVEALAPSDVEEFYRRWYRPGNMVLSMAGRLDEEQIWRCAERCFGSMEGEAPASGYSRPAFGSGGSWTDRGVSQTHFTLGFPGPDACDERRYAYEVLVSALGGGSSSRLFDRIREQEGLAYSIYAFRSSYLQSGSIGIYAAVAPENLDHTVRITCDELRALREGPMSEEELALNREQLKAGFLMSLESTFNRMGRIAKSLIYHDRILAPEETCDGIARVTADDVQQAAREALLSERATAVILGPRSNGDTVELDL